MTDRIEVQRTIRADPSTIFNVLTDPAGHVQIDASGMLMSSSGRPATAVGDTFVIHMDREALGDRPLGLYDVTVRILTFEQDREIAWTVDAELLDASVEHIYGYRLEPAAEDGATLVTSYYDWSKLAPIWVERGLDKEFPIVPESALKATLGILARTVQKA
jgi:uncharacterized protein YndB with AHSA1/START domain